MENQSIMLGSLCEGAPGLAVVFPEINSFSGNYSELYFFGYFYCYSHNLVSLIGTHNYFLYNNNQRLLNISYVSIKHLVTESSQNTKMSVLLSLFFFFFADKDSEILRGRARLLQVCFSSHLTTDLPLLGKSSLIGQFKSWQKIDSKKQTNKHLTNHSLN